MVGITIDTTLRAYAEKHRADILSKMYAEDPFRNILPLISGVQDTYVADEVTVSELIQAYQKGFTPKGGVSIAPEILRTFGLKVDFVFTPKDIEKTYLGHLKTSGSKPYDLPLERYIINRLMEKIGEELGYVTVNGVYVAPTTGTAGNMVDSMDGILHTLADLITATKIAPTTTGDVTADNIIDKIIVVWKSIPEKYRMKKMTCWLSETHLYNYFEKRKSLYGTHQDYVPGKTVVDFTNCALRALPNSGATDRIIITFADNLVLLEDGTAEDQVFEVEKSERQVKVMFDFKRGAGFLISGPAGATVDTQYVWCNDQA
jgi:hypothetical protein